MFGDDDPFDSAAAVDQGAGALKLRVALKGRPLRTHVFTKDIVTVGRDPDADVFLDNPGVSREHVRIEKTPNGYIVEDLGSANGTYLNDEPVQTKLLAKDDVLRIGKFTLWIAFEDRRSKPREAAPATTAQGTTVLSTGELEKMMTKMRDFEVEPLVEDVPPPARARMHSRPWLIAAVFLLGIAVGAAALWVLVR